ncbi:hypothetical protein [Nesterenkonia xinjiangensis]|uniref:Uncharacterized protein n=1 Tax=Nesterenkonia xinjiangensis TaxID=225327 RepID=A0A7Z0GJ76_9MICC|nr:hypothetical protein [Nesterenkonia xinjiangensis]NYJ76982.1 hypothetical protein [Nesterenkonia xinjiangensis]
MPHTRPRVLLLSDDDAVTGTLRRLTRIGEKLHSQADVVMATLSSTEPPGPQGPPFPLQRIGSARRLNMDPETWAKDYLLPRLDRLIGGFEPDVLVVDGDFPAWLLDRLRRTHGVSWVDVVSAMDAQERSGAAPRTAELTIEVGELVDGRLTSRSSGTAAHSRVEVDPVLDAAVLDAAAGSAQNAEANLAGDATARPTVVVDLAGLSPDTAAAAEDLALEWFAAHQKQWTVALLDSAVARRVPAGAEKVAGGLTPELVARTVAALAVPGFRALHTWVPAGVPALWLTEGPAGEEPLRGAARRSRRRLRPEQQQALRTRAVRAADAGWGLREELEGPHDVDRLRARLTAALETMDARGAELAGPREPFSDGAEQAAQAVLERARRHLSDPA